MASSILVFLLLATMAIYSVRATPENKAWRYARGVNTAVLCFLTLYALFPIADLLFDSSTVLGKGAARLPLSTAFGIDELFPGSTNWFQSFVTMTAVSALYNGYFGTPAPFNVDCPSGNCAWNEPYTTLAVCSSCTDLTSSLEPLTDAEGKDVGLLLPNGFLLRYNADWGLPIGERQQYTSMNATSAPVGQPPALKALEYDSIAYTEMSGKFLDTFVVVGSDPSAAQYMSESPAPAAYECAMQWCLQQSTAKMVDGKLTEKLVNIINDTTVDVQDPGRVYAGKISRQLTDPKTNMLYNISMGAEATYSRMMSRMLNDSRVANISGDAVPLTALWSAIARPEDSPAKLFEHLASSITTFMRTENSAILGANYSTAVGVVLKDSAATTSTGWFSYVWAAMPLVMVSLVWLCRADSQKSVQLDLEDADEKKEAY